MKEYSGNCHCGEVKYKFFSEELVDIWNCNCSICDINCYQHLFVKHELFEIISGHELLSEYNFGTGSAKHLQIFNRAQNNSSNLNANSKKKILQKIKEIVEELSQFRFKEGSVLEKDLLNNINSIYSNLERINKRAIKRKNQIRTKLQNKILALKEVDKERFEQEIIYYIEKYDINEELIRLDSHLNLFQKNINSNKPVGKKLGFISQEIGREINTIGSKANDFNIQKIVISMKENLEKVKEQILNVL